MNTHYLKQHAHFSNAEELNMATDLHILQHRKSLTVSDLQVLDAIRRHSEEHGAAHLKCTAIEYETGKSNATVRRAIRKLVKLEIIRKVHFIQPVTMGLGGNVYAVLPNCASASHSHNSHTTHFGSA